MSTYCLVKAVMSYSETVKCSTTRNGECKACAALLVAQCLSMASRKLMQLTHWKQWHSELRFHKNKLWCSILHGYFILIWKIPLLNKRKNNKRNSCLAFDPKGIQWMSMSGEWRRPLEAEWLGTVPVKETQSSADPGEGRGGTLGSHIHMGAPGTFLRTIVTVCTKVWIQRNNCFVYWHHLIRHFRRKQIISSWAFAYTAIFPCLL